MATRLNDNLHLVTQTGLQYSIRGSFQSAIMATASELDIIRCNPIRQNLPFESYICHMGPSH
jgi:hypothetical protein